MSDFVKQASSFTSENKLTWLEAFQSQNEDEWNTVAFPHRKTEHWKYTSLRWLEQGDVFKSVPSLVESSSAETLIAKSRIEGLDSFDVVFVNGRFNEELSSPMATLPSGMTLTRLAAASVDEQKAFAGLLGSVAKGPEHIFSTLNACQLNDGVVIQVDKNTKIEKAVRILHLTLGQDEGATISPRVYVSLEQGSEATVVEHFATDSAEQKIFVNSITELDVGANARLRHYRLHLEEESALHIGGVHANLAKSSTLESFHLALGGKLKRIDCVVNHLGEGAHCEMNGLYLPRHKQHVDYHTVIEHAVPHCTTDEVFRGIIGDSAKAVFNGRIHIHRDAQKTLAKLSNKNLLTSNKAEIDTKPELEIYADDVLCAHGATVSQLDDGAMHYLMTRGVSEKEARMMLSFGFINELINKIRDESIADFLRPQLAELFSREPVLCESKP